MLSMFQESDILRGEEEEELERQISSWKSATIGPPMVFPLQSGCAPDQEVEEDSMAEFLHLTVHPCSLDLRGLILLILSPYTIEPELRT